MPAAIDRNILMACTAESSSGGESRITVSNVNPRFTTEEVVYKPGKTGPQLDQKAHTWVNYFKVNDRLPNTATNSSDICMLLRQA